MKELIERLEHTDEISGDSVVEVREALKKQSDALERMTAERDALRHELTMLTGEANSIGEERDALADDLGKYKGICDSLLHDLDANASHCDALAAGACCEPNGLTADDGGVIYCQIAKELNARTPLSRTQILNIHALPNWPRTQFADKGYGIALDTVSVVDFVRMIEAAIQGEQP